MVKDKGGASHWKNVFFGVNLCVAYNVVVILWARVLWAAVQWAVLSGNCIPVTVEVVGHDIDEFQVTVGYNIPFKSAEGGDSPQRQDTDKIPDIYG